MSDFTVIQRGLFIDRDLDVNRIQSDLKVKVAKNMNILSGSLVKSIQLAIKTRSGPPGRAYKRKGGRVHIASSPGFPAQYDTGKLSRGTYFSPAKGSGTDALESHIGSNPVRAGAKVNYAVFLVTGTRRMEARPFFFKIIEQVIKTNETMPGGTKGFTDFLEDIRFAIENNLRVRPGTRTIIK